MSYAVLRGNPTAAQLYLDSLLDGTRESFKYNGIVKERCDVNMAEILYFCMKKNLNGLHMINGASGEKISNRQILSRAIPLARALSDKYEEGTIIMFVMRNHQHTAVIYYASIFANVIPLMIEPNSTSHELSHFLKLVSPAVVFCDKDRFDDVKREVNELTLTNTAVIISNDNAGLKAFYKGYSDNLDDFQVSKAMTNTDALFVPTSGSSGLPKATILNHAGLMAQLPTIWVHEEKFPEPTKLALLLSTAQWMTFTILMTCCPVYGVSLLMTPQEPTTEHVLEIIDKYRPTYALLGPNTAKKLGASSTSSQLSSIETVITGGAPLTENIVISLKEKLPKSASFKNGFGTTEAHGFISIPGPQTHWSSNGKIANVLDYKIVSPDGEELKANQKGQLCLKSRLCIFKGYYKNEAVYRETVTSEGWYKTGDIVYEDENKEIYFIETKKFWFKYLNYIIAPEEVERVISSVSGIRECVVVDSDNGPTVAVVFREDCSVNKHELKQLIHRAVDSTLSDYKRLRGGIVFVDNLPCLPNGKVNRTECKKLVASIKESKEYFKNI